MKLTVDRFVMESDERQFTIDEMVQPRDETKPVYKKLVGHYSSIEDAFQCFLDKAMMLSDKILIEEVIREIRAYRKMVKETLEARK